MDAGPVSTALAVLVVVLVGLLVALARRPRGMAGPGGAGSADAVVLGVRAELAAQRAALTDLQARAVEALARVGAERVDERLQVHEHHRSRENAVMGQRIEELRGELRRMTGLVQHLESEGAARIGAIDAKLDHAARSTRDLAAATATLREALASSRTRGQWGERMCDDVLRAAGMVEGVNYVRQATQQDADGRRGRPDVTFLLPGDRCLHLDVKFPLDNFLRHVDAPDGAAADRARAAFVRDVRGRVRELTTRTYVDPAGGTLGYCLLFVPNEQVYAFAHESDPALIDQALANKVVLCSPLTLFAVLAVVRQAADAQSVERRSGEVLAALGRFEDQWDRFCEQLDKVGRALDSTSRNFAVLDGRRRRALERELELVADVRARLPDGPVAREGTGPATGQG